MTKRKSNSKASKPTAKSAPTAKPNPAPVAAPATTNFKAAKPESAVPSFKQNKMPPMRLHRQSPRGR